MHEMLTGTGPGRRHKVEVLNKSAVLFLCASFEAFIEDLSVRAFDHIVLKSPTPSALPKSIRKTIAESLKNDPNVLKVWDLAGDGWKAVAGAHKKAVLDRHVGKFNTPKPGIIEQLLKDLIGFEDADNAFTWKNMNSKNAKEKLKSFVEIRGALALGESPAPKVGKAKVISYLNFLAPLSVRFSNEVARYVEKQTGHLPWSLAHFNSIE